MERQTQSIQIGSHALEVKTYATGRETQAIQSVYFKGTKVSVAGGAPTFNEIDPSVMFEVQAEMIRQLVVSLDGTTENIVDRCLDLPNEELQAIIAAIDELISKKNS